MTDTKTQAKWIRWFRWFHRKLAIFLFIFFLIISITGLLLGLKKQTGLLAPTQTGSSKELSTWLPVDSLYRIAIKHLHDSVDALLSVELDRIDIRPKKGIVKFIFQDHYRSLQIDGTTGKVLSVEKRKSDIIENIHDGSILDRVFGTGGDTIKVGYTALMATSLFMMVLSGFWLWYGPKRLRRTKRKIQS